MTILVFAGVLSIPSAVFAEASWYGSLRIGIESSDSNIRVADGPAGLPGSRWGIRGSAEAGDGLTAVYQFEHKIDSRNASQGAGRLSYVGLSGGFGSLTLGQFWSASFNATGAMTDNSNYYGDAETTYRHGNAVSYAFSNDLMSLQADVVYADGLSTSTGLDTEVLTDDKPAGDDPNEDLERVEFGLTINIGDTAAVAFSHKNDKYAVTNMGLADNGAAATDTTNFATYETKSNIVVAQISVSGITVYAGKKKESYDVTGSTTNTASTVVSIADDETTFFGARGSIGDTGLGYVFQWRDKDTYKPWILALNKSLGDNVSIRLEHANNNGNSANATQVGLRVDF